MFPLPGRGLALLLAALLSAPEAVSPDQQLTAGIGLVKDGDFDSAIPRLSAAIQGLSPDLRRRVDLARAYLYLGIAYLELGQELEARGKFRETLRNDPKLKLSPREFSGQVLRVFEEERLAAQPQKKRRNLLLPLVLIAGGGAASAGIAAASSGRSGETTTTLGGGTTTTTAPGGGGGGTTTTTLSPGPTTTRPGTTTTTVPGPTTTTVAPGTTTTTTTTMPACSYSLSPDRTFGAAGGTGTCNITVSAPSCAWSVEATAGWINLQGATNGTGSDNVSYSVGLLLLGTRSAVIRAQQDPGARCTITQDALLANARAPQVTWASLLDLPGGRGQIVVNETELAYQEDAPLRHTSTSRGGQNRIEAHVVSATGQPGSWRFELLSGAEPGSLQVIAGQAALVGGNSVVFRLSGQAGEHVVFVFRGAR